PAVLQPPPVAVGRTVPRLPPDDYRLGHARRDVKVDICRQMPRGRRLSLHSVKALCDRAFR
ncbi:MAG: hypothetical protein FWB78_10350, partial [Treponema sp.]|nr:hypothetical protein [Treponema sp.]